MTLPGALPAFPNSSISFPTITQATAGNSTRIVGTFHGAASTTILIDVYVSLVADPSGYGEGQRYLGTITVTTNASGDATFDSIMPAKSAKGSFVTATATDVAGNSSEFGPNVIAF